ncbi:MAG: adenosylcobinamide-GDP ribazoletransferase [Clostridia bacterium]|nr:adenosylcobinamide-GDP ribazoletransferase [Clostridia bacterium]
MKKYFRALMMSMSMFCAIPCPFRKWDEDARPLMTLFLPAVGLWIGGLWTLMAFIARWLSIPALVAGFILCAFPFVITGGIHIDGFLDVVDAVRSWRDLEERRKILKDPHVGSFAVVAAILLILAQFALLSTAAPAEWKYYFTLTLIAVVSRCTAAICVTVLRPLSTSEYSGAYRKGVKKSHVVVLSIVLAAAIALGFVFLGWYGFAALAVIAGYLLALIRGFRSLDGMSGDISGYALTFGELCGIAVYALI